MRVAVTGATGHIGANLVRQLLADGCQVRALVRDDVRALAGLDVEHTVGDVFDADALASAFAGSDVVFHLAALISITGAQGGRVHAVNVLGTRNVVRACLEAGVRRLVHFSSIHAFRQFPHEEVLDERRAPSDSGPAPAYDHSKACGEREVMAGAAAGLEAVILNPTAVIGPYDFKPSHMGRVLLALARRRLPALVAGAFDWVDARDVCRAAITAARAGRTGERYLLSGTYLSVRGLAALVGEVTGTRAPRMTAPQWLARPGAPLAAAWSRVARTRPLFTPDSLAALRTCNPHISHAKASVELAFTPRPLRDTVADTLDWFVAAGRLPAGLRQAAL